MVVVLVLVLCGRGVVAGGHGVVVLWWWLVGRMLGGGGGGSGGGGRGGTEWRTSGQNGPIGPAEDGTHHGNIEHASGHVEQCRTTILAKLALAISPREIWPEWANLAGIQIAKTIPAGLEVTPFAPTT